jgi:hypothetical protein
MIVMVSRHLFPLVPAMFFLGGCCHADNLLHGPAAPALPPLARPELAQAAFVRPGDAPLCDVVPRTLEHIPVGTVIGQDAPKDWTNLILFATPTLSEEDVRDAPKMATHYVRMFKYTLLANVVRLQEGARTSFKLQRVACGFAAPINGRETVIDSKNTLGADLGLYGRRILTESEALLDKEVLQVARTDTMLVVDDLSTMLAGKDHIKMTMRHAIVVDPDTGRLATFVWLLSKTPSGFDPAERALQLLPPNLHEARLLHVLRDRFTLGIPSADAFALVRVPQGTPVPYTPELAKAAAPASFTRDQVFALESALRRAVKGSFVTRP